MLTTIIVSNANSEFFSLSSQGGALLKILFKGGGGDVPRVPPWFLHLCGGNPGNRTYACTGTLINPYVYFERISVRANSP